MTGKSERSGRELLRSGSRGVYRLAVTGVRGLKGVDGGVLREGIKRTLHRHGCERAAISIALVDDARMAELNARFLNHRGPTDVLTFDLSDAPGEVEGEIVISTDTARREATRRNHSLEDEILLYAIHGTLHLLGYGDASKAEAARMHRMEDDLLEEMGRCRVYGTKRRVQGSGFRVQGQGSVRLDS